MNKKENQKNNKTDIFITKQKQNIHQQNVKKQQKQISLMFKDLSLTQKPQKQKKIQKEEIIDSTISNQYINQNNNILLFSDQQDDDNFQKQHQIFMQSQEMLPSIIQKFKEDKTYNLDEVLIIFQNETQDFQNLQGISEFLEIVCQMLKMEKQLDQKIVKKSFGVLMNGIETYLYYDDQGTEFMKDMTLIEWTPSFTIKYMLLFLQRQTKRFYFVADNKKMIVFDFFLKCFCLLDKFHPQIVDISNHLFKYEMFRAFINQKRNLIEGLPSEKKYFIQSFMANYADIQIDREKLFQRVQTNTLQDSFLKQTQINLQRMLYNQILIEKQIINQELVDALKKL